MDEEELMNMTREDLIRRVKELNETNESLENERDMWYKSYSELKKKFDGLKNAIKSIILISD